MIQVKLGNLFESKAQTLVNTVNCVGVMGKGIALDFKKRFPEMYRQYERLCAERTVKPGEPYYYQDLTGVSIINFPTKDSWRSPSRLSYITAGLKWFRDHYQELGIQFVAFPPLGCGNGGLKWEVVGPIMYDALKDLPIEIEIYAPYGTSMEQLSQQYLSTHIINSPQEVLGSGALPYNDRWLLLLQVVREVNDSQYTLHVGRVIFQKICYVLTRTGVKTGFAFRKGSYGPYSAEVKQAITVLSNANLISERQSGSHMVETIVSSHFQLDTEKYNQKELDGVIETVDLFSRIKNTDQAEMMTTIIYSFDQLRMIKNDVSEEDIYTYVLDWKKKWKQTHDDEIKQTIRDLAMLKWINPTFSVEQNDDYS